MKTMVGLAGSWLFAFCGCTCPAGASSSGVQSSPQGDDVLVVYFSRAGENYGVGTVSVGTTAIMAGYIQEVTGVEVRNAPSESRSAVKNWVEKLKLKQS